MSIRKKAGILLSLWVCLSVSGDGVLLENDLSSLHLVNLRGEIKSVYNEGTRKIALHIRITHPYTNSLACSGHVSFSVEGSKNERDMEFKELLIFPDAAFGKPLSFPLSVSLQPGEVLSPYFHAERDVVCHGWDTQIPLPTGLCKNPAMVPGLAQACAVVPSGSLVPWIRNGAFLGSCRC
jgi:hypothetical protein